VQWYIRALKKYAVFTGRARRKEYWMYTLVNCVALAVLTVIGRAAHTTVPYLVYTAAVFLPSVGVLVRRLHDTSHSGWALLLFFIPLVGIVLFLVYTCSEGDRGQNAHGLDPKMAADGTYPVRPPAHV